MKIIFRPLGLPEKTIVYTTMYRFFKIGENQGCMIDCLTLKHGVDCWMNRLERSFDYSNDTIQVLWQNETIDIANEEELAIAVLSCGYV
jgi:hypothetical protein